MKGQMMLITSIVVSLILISVGAALTNINVDTDTRTEGYYSNMMQNQASQVDMRYQNERQNFINLVESMEEYETEVVYWEEGHGPNGCFNITMERQDSTMNINCIN